MRWRFGGRCCWPSRRPSARPIPSLRQRLLTFVIVGGGPTGVELAGALAEIARQSLVEDFRSIRPESARIILLEGGPHILSTFPEKLRVAASESLKRLGVEVQNTGDCRRHQRARACASATSASRRRRCCGRRASPRRRFWRRSACRSIAPAACSPSRPSPSPAIRRSSSSATRARCKQDGVAAARRRAGRHAGRRARRAQRVARDSRRSRRRRFATATTATWRQSAAARRLPTSPRCKFSGFLAWLIWLFIHIFSLIGFRNRLAVMGEWAWAYVTFQRRARLITGERLSPGERVWTGAGTRKSCHRHRAYLPRRLATSSRTLNPYSLRPTPDSRLLPQSLSHALI